VRMVVSTGGVGMMVGRVGVGTSVGDSPVPPDGKVMVGIVKMLDGGSGVGTTSEVGITRDVGSVVTWVGPVVGAVGPALGSLIPLVGVGIGGRIGVTSEMTDDTSDETPGRMPVDSDVGITVGSAGVFGSGAVVVGAVSVPSAVVIPTTMPLEGTVATGDAVVSLLGGGATDRGSEGSGDAEGDKTVVGRPPVEPGTMNGPWKTVESPVAVGASAVGETGLGDTTEAGAWPVGAAPELGAVAVGDASDVGDTTLGRSEAGRSEVGKSEVGRITGGMIPPVDAPAVFDVAGSDGGITGLGMPPVLPTDEGTLLGFSGVGSFGSGTTGSLVDVEVCADVGLTGDSGTPFVVPSSAPVVLEVEGCGGGGGGGGDWDVVGGANLGSVTASPVPVEGTTGLGFRLLLVVVSGSSVGLFGVGGSNREENHDAGSRLDCRNSMFDEDVLVVGSLVVVEVVISVDELVTI
jgi:hypothetical protein